jgi:RNA polymerase sigma-70 factor (family 1)
MSNALTDKALLLSNEENGFRILYDRYWQDLFQKAKTRLGNAKDAEDIIQDIFVTVWNNRATITIEDSLQPYLFTALKYCIIKKVERDYKRKKTYPLDIDNADSIQITNEDLLQYKELEELIAAEVDLLPDRMKQIYRLSKQEQLTIRDIAVQLNLSEQTVKNILGESVKRLRIKLAKYQFIIFL